MTRGNTKVSSNESPSDIVAQDATPNEEHEQEQAEPQEAAPAPAPIATAPAPKPRQDREPTNGVQTPEARVKALEARIERMEAASKLDGIDVVDLEVCTDLLIKGYTVEELKSSKPYLFKQPKSDVVRQPKRLITDAKPPSAQVSDSGAFVEKLSAMLTSKF